MPHLVFAFVLGYISMSHIYRTYVDYMGWSLDFTGPQVEPAQGQRESRLVAHGISGIRERVHYCRTK